MSNIYIYHNGLHPYFKGKEGFLYEKKTKNYRGLQYLLLLLLMVFLVPSARAAETVTVDQGICPNKIWATDTPWYGLVSAGWISAPVRFELTDGHKAMNITLMATESYTFTGDASEALGVDTPKTLRGAILNAVNRTFSPGATPNAYSVYFEDYDGNRVWSEQNAIPNGGRREFYVGTNVKYICVYSWYNMGSGSYRKGGIPGSVTYSNAYEIQ